MTRTTFASAAAPVRQQPELKLVEITHDAPEAWLLQLRERDRVHLRGADSIENLRKFRLGGEKFNRTCYAVMNGEQIESAIYVHKDYERVPSYDRLNGNVRNILTTEHEWMGSKTPNSFIFYSISNIGKVAGSGSELIRQMHARLSAEYPDAVKSTLSPVRPFDAWHAVNKNGIEKITPMTVAKYLLSGNDIILPNGDIGVQRFHGGNGAKVGAVQLNSGDISNEGFPNQTRHAAMANYVYDFTPEQLNENKLQMRAIHITLKDTTLTEEERERMIEPMILKLCTDDFLKQIGYKTAPAAIPVNGTAAYAPVGP